MPVVSTESIRLHGSPFSLKINYSSPRKRFYINLPKYVASTLNQKDVSVPMIRPDDFEYKEYDPEFWVRNKFDEAVKQYDDIVQRKQKVIFYTFKSKVRPVGFPGSGSSIHPHHEVHTAGIGLDLWYCPGFILIHPVDSTRTFFDLSGKDLGNSTWTHSDWRYMDYTPEREAFFEKFREYLENGITNMSTFFNQENDMVAQLIDTGMTPALPGPIKEVTVEVEEK